jgi:membrane protein DedA with SNARE-associated domain
MTKFLDSLLGQQGALVYVLVGLVVFAEDALFVGFVLPGETAAILGGVAASRGNVSVTLMCGVVVAAAIIGDSVGYEIGARYGARLLSLSVLRRRAARIDSARDILARRGGPAVFFGRFVAFLRAVMPFLAGSAHMHYRRFLIYNAAGGLVWGIGTVLLGYLAGNSYAAIEKTFGRVAAIIVAALIVIGLIVWRIRRHRQKSAAESAPESAAKSDNGAGPGDSEH